MFNCLIDVKNPYLMGSLLKINFFKSEFTKNSFTLILGTVLAQLIPFILQLFLRRMYTPEDFGVFSIYFSLLSVLVIMASLRYESTIVLPKNDVESVNVLALSVFLSVSFSFFLFLITLFFKEKICDLLNFPLSASNYLYLLPLSSLFFSLYQIINFWLIRKKMFVSSSINKITRRFFEGATQITFGLSTKSSGLIMGDLIGNFANFFSGCLQLKRSDFNLKWVSKSKMFFVLKKYRDFPIYNLVPTLLCSIANIIPYLLINKFYSTQQLGFIDLTKMVLSIPLALISVTISQVLFQQITSKINNRESLKRELLNIFYFIALIGIIEIIVVLSFAPELFALVFGDDYKLSGEISQILVFSFVFNFLTSSFSSVFIAMQKIRLYSFWQVSYFIVMCFLYFFENKSFNYFISLFVLFEVVMSLLYSILLIMIVINYENNLLYDKKI